MTFEIVQLPNRAKFADFAIVEKSRVVTLAIWRNRDRMYSNWWASGITNEGELRLLAAFELPLHLADEPEALEECVRIYQSSVSALLEQAEQTDGLPEPRFPPPVEVRRELALLHLQLHQERGTLGELASAKSERAALQFQLIKSFGYSAATPLMAEYEGVPKTTIAKRLWLARDTGILPKVSEVATSNESKE